MVWPLRSRVMFVSADHDPVVGAVDQVAVQGRVGGDGVAAAHVACERLTGAENAESSHHQHKDYRLGNPPPSVMGGQQPSGRAGTGQSRLCIGPSYNPSHQLWVARASFHPVERDRPSATLRSLDVTSGPA
jgi:hypothetical protein